MPDKEPTVHLLYWDAPWAPPPEVIRVQVSEGLAHLEITLGAINPKTVTLDLTAEQAQGLAMKLHEAALCLTLPAEQAHAISGALRDHLLAAQGATTPFWMRGT